MMGSFNQLRSSGRAKPKARLCEPWVVIEKVFRSRGAATAPSQWTVRDWLKCSMNWRSGAAPRLRNIVGRVTQGSQSLALGLALPLLRSWLIVAD
jgi:hypothetical protein